MKILLAVLALLVLAPLAILGGMIAFVAPKAPPALPFMTAKDDVFASYVRAQPPARTFSARDGKALSYRFYEGRPGGGVAVAIHGSSGSNIAVHGLATALQAEGVTVYAPDLRGHGENGTEGDVAYIGQLEDDLSDLVALVSRERPSEKRLLIGHSQGGGFTLKVASGPRASEFDAYLAAAPFMGATTPMNRPGTAGWADAAIPRIIALSILNGFGVTAFNHMPVVAYAVPEGARGARTRINTFALLASASFDRDWQAGLRRIGTRPTVISIGEKDELFVAEAYAPNVAAVNPAIRVAVLPGTGHMDAVLDKAPVEATVGLALGLLKR